MLCALHPSDSTTGVCASCLTERLTHLLQLQHDRFRLSFSQPLPAPSPPQLNTHADRITRTQSVLALPPQDEPNNGNKKPIRAKFSFLSRFKHGQGHEEQGQGQGHGQSKPRTRTDKMHVNSEVGSWRPSKKESGEDTRKPRAISAWISALLPRRHREKKSQMPAPAPVANSSANPSFLSARSSDDGDFAGRDKAFHEQLSNSGPVAYEFEGYYSDSDLMKRGGGGDARIFPRVKRRVENCIDWESRAASSSTTARVNIFSESEEDESRRASPQADPPRRGNSNCFFSGVFPSPAPKSKAYSKRNHLDCAGSFSPYTDRKLQSTKPFSMARAENSGFAFGPSPRKIFHREISRSPRRGGKLSNFFFSPSRRAA